MSESYIRLSPSGTSCVGPDATLYFRALSLRGAIGLYVKSNGQIIPTRGMGITKMLTLSSEFTGKKYKRTQTADAMHDLDIWIANMRSALPVIQGS